MRPDYDSLVEGQRRDLELGAALAALPQPELPDDVDARLRAAVQKERRRNRRRPGWPELLAVLLLVAVVGGALAWRYVPPTRVDHGPGAERNRAAPRQPDPDASGGRDRPRPDDARRARRAREAGG